jgi:drug/metabolite transporter (DMT)-like permease
VVEVSLPGPAYPLLTALAWSAAVILFKKSGDAMAPAALNFFKNALAIVLFAVTFPLLGYTLPDAPATDILALLASGAIGIGIADTLFFASLNLLGAQRSAIVDSTYAPSVVLVSYLLLGETLESLDAVGACLIVGAVFLAAAPKQLAPADKRRIVLGATAGIIAMVLMAIGIVSVKRILERYDVLWSTSVRLLGGLAVLSLWLLVRPDERRATVRAFLPQPSWRWALPGAFLGTYVSLLFWVSGFKYNAASVASILNQTSTLFTVVLAAFFLGEGLSARRAAAVTLALAGSLLVLL